MTGATAFKLWTINQLISLNSLSLACRAKQSIIVQDNQLSWSIPTRALYATSRHQLRVFAFSLSLLNQSLIQCHPPSNTHSTHTRYNFTHANLSRNKHSTKLASLLPVYCQKNDLLPVCHETSRGRAWGSRCWASPRGCCCTPPSQGYIRRRRNTYAREHVDLVQSHPLLLDGNVGEVNEQVVHLTSAVIILHRAKPGGVSALQLQILLERAHRQKPSLKR